MVFTDGSRSGFLSNIKVTKVNAVEFFVVNGVQQLMSPLMVADQVNGLNAVGDGDSDGPVGRPDPRGGPWPSHSEGWWRHHGSLRGHTCQQHTLRQLLVGPRRTVIPEWVTLGRRGVRR
jgi:hypothetical protein